MESFPLEELISSIQDKDSPGSQLYLYRILHQLINSGAPGSGADAIPYKSARRLAARLGLDRPEKLTSLFRDLGLGTLQLKIEGDYIQAQITPVIAPAQTISQQGACELERGLIDGALELITGVQVTTAEGKCWTRGDGFCKFEARRDDFSETPRFVPVSTASRSLLTPGPGGKARVGIDQPGLRSWFMDMAARELARTQRHGRSLTVLYVDLDDLGKINTAHGRRAGDQIISAVSAALCRSCRTEDYLWHNGEDEFAVVLPETDTESAEIIARRLSTEILSSAEYIDVPATVSASIGYSTFPIHGENLNNLFSSARSAVYVAKSLGKGMSKAAIPGDESAFGSADRVLRRRGLNTRHSAYRDNRKSGSPGSMSYEQAGPEEVDDSESAKGPADTAVRKDAPEAGNDIAARVQPVSIMIASLGPLLVAGMKQVISGTEGMAIVREINEPSRLIAAVVDDRPDIIFSDLQTVQSNDHEMLRQLEHENLPCKCVVYVTNVDQDVIKLVADFRIDGVILQDSTAPEIVTALETVYKGRSVLPHDIESAINELESSRKLLEELSEREIEVLRLVAEGKSNAQISQDLFITVNTVRFHLANIYQKLSVSNRTEAANYYLRQDLASPDGQTKLL